MLIGMTGLDQAVDGGGHLAVFIERRLEVIHVEAHAEGLQIKVLLVAQIGHRKRPDRIEIIRVGATHNRLDAQRRHRSARQIIAGNVGDVGAAIAALGKARIVGVDAARPGLYREREIGDLDTRIVVIELALNLPAAGLEQRGDRIAQRSLSAMTDMQRPGGVGRHELDQDLAARAKLVAPEAIALREDHAEHFALGAGGQTQIDEARTGDLGRFDQLSRTGGLHQINQRLRNRTRVALERLGDLQGEVAGKVAMISLLGSLEQGLGTGRDLDGIGIAAGGGKLDGRCLEGAGKPRSVFG